MGDWDLALPEYWDQRTNAMTRHALRLRALEGEDREAACRRVREAVRRQASVLGDRELLQAAVSMTDDLYKYVNDEIVADPALYQYTEAFAATLCELVRERGYVIRYVVDNTFSGLDFLRLGPFDLFRKVFNAAGFVYACPQLVAYAFAQRDRAGESEIATVMAQHSAEARMLADRLVDECTRDSRHLIFLEADYEDGALDHALQGAKEPGVLLVFRNDAPLPGTTVSCSFPDEKRPT